MARFLGSLILIALTVGALLATWPQLADLDMQAPWAQIVAMRGTGAAAALFVAMVLVLVRAGAGRARGYLSALSFIFFVFAAANVGVLLFRGVFPADLPKPQQEQIRILEWNTLGDQVKIEYLARAVDEVKPTVIVLPETTNGHATELAKYLKDDLGEEFIVHTVAFDQVYKARSTSVLVNTTLGDYAIVDTYGNTSVVPSVVLEPVIAGSGPRIVGIHSVSPVSGEMNRWREDFKWLDQMCALPDTIIAGDTNATPDQHHSLQGCELASLQSRAGGLGTWPTTLPAIMGAQVDQVMTTSGWKSVGFSVMSSEDASGSDHRPIASVIVPAQ